MLLQYFHLNYTMFRLKLETKDYEEFEDKHLNYTMFRLKRFMACNVCYANYDLNYTMFRLKLKKLLFFK